MMDPDVLVAVAAAAGAVVVGFILLIGVIKQLLFICGPHEILVFSGGKHKLSDGSTANFKIIRGGRGFRTPLLEVVRRMDMRLFPVEVVVQNAYSAGGIPLTVRAIANVKLASDDISIRNAVERFLDYPQSQIAVAAQQTLEGVLREVVSELTPEEVNEDRLKFAGKLIDNARDDFHKLGLDLDVLKVQHVSDDQEYLSNLGRARVANMLRDAENAENAANQAVAEAKAVAREAAETASKVAETQVVTVKNDAEAELATLNAEAQEVENQATMAAETARVKAEQRLQELRAKLEKLRLHNDVVLPAQAKRKAEELKARGQAAPVLENGKAAAEALRLVATEWSNAGDAGSEVYVRQRPQSRAAAAAARVAQSEIGTIKLVGGDEQAYSTVLSSHPTAVASVLRETGRALGIDMDRLLRVGGGSVPDAAGRRTLPPKVAGGGGLLPEGPRTQRIGDKPRQKPTVPGMPASGSEVSVRGPLVGPEGEPS